MAAPTFAQASAGAVATTTLAGPSLTGTTVGNVILFQIVQDGTTAGEPGSLQANGTAEDLAGTDNVFTKIGAFDIGSPAAAKQHLYLCRSLSSTNINFLADPANVGGDDLYSRAYEFNNVITAALGGVSLATVIENATAGTATNGAGTSVTVADTGVTTLGADRLALNCVGINDDATGFAAFTGQSGGTWALTTAIFESATGTDATVALVQAAMASAGTINGGTDTITSDGWGVVGFALIGTTVAAGAVPHDPIRALEAVNRGSVW